MKKLSNEVKVGFLVLATLGLIVFFAWVIGVQNPFEPKTSFYVTYNFAGGIEEGSPVRVSGIKVGKVTDIEFFAPQNKDQQIAQQNPGSASPSEQKAVAPVKLKLSVSQEATRGIRQDSRFYINLAGIIGQRYIEVTPGSLEAERIQSGDVLQGVDPPRIDQLISQSFDLAGKIQKILEENEGDIGRSIELLYQLSENLNKTLDSVEKSKIFEADIQKLINNLIRITSDVEKLTKKVDTPEGKKTLKLLHELLWRLKPLDEEAIEKFLQKEGVKVHMF